MNDSERIQKIGNKAIDIQIIVPVYNVEPYLDEFFKCMLNQTIQNFIVIMVNDASTDGSYQKIEEYQSLFFGRMILINNEHNLGLSGARNIGLNEAEKHPTKYITFLDPDDLIDPEYLQDLFDNAEKYQAGITISGVQRFEDETNHVICNEMIWYSNQYVDDISCCDDFAYMNPCAYAKLYRFEKIKSIRFRPIKRSEDTCYLFEILPHLKSAKFTNNAHYHYRVRKTSLSGAINEDKYHSMHEHFAEMMKLFSSKDYVKYKEMFEMQIFIHSSVGGVCRYSFSNMGRSVELCKRELSFLDSSVPEWRKNKYLTFHKKMNKGLKPFFLRVCALMYKIRIFPIFIYIYYFTSQILKKDIRA